MNKAILVLKREYLTRVKKKSFIILTILMPILMIIVFTIPAYLATKEDKSERTIAVYDESSMFLDQLKGKNSTKLKFIPEEEYQKIKDNLKGTSYYALLYIPKNILTSNQALIYSDKQVPIDISEMIENRIENIVERDKKNKVIEETGIPDLEQKLAATRTKINLKTLKFQEEGKAKETSSLLVGGIGYVTGFLIYMFLFMYGSMVMQGVMEEKTSRVVEIIISSVKPVELMFGKIIGIALVGLTQVAIWFILGAVLFVGAQAFFGGGVEQVQQAQSLMNPQMMGSAQQIAPKVDEFQKIIDMAGALPLATIAISFLIYFLGGYLLYSSLMAAIGSAADSQEEAGQMLFPVTIPLILSIMILFPVAKNPEGSVAFWASMIPFFSPVVMMARIPYGVPLWEILLSMFILFLTIAGAIWAAAKIYRTGILMYGKKVNLKELVKWLRYKN